MALAAVVSGLRTLTRPCAVQIEAPAPKGYAAAEYRRCMQRLDLWDEMTTMMLTHTVEWQTHFDAPATLCGWCFHRFDWWLRPDEWGGGWVCGNCHPDPRKHIAITIWTADPREHWGNDPRARFVGTHTTQKENPHERTDE